MSHYPRRRITITACVLLVLGYALLRLPLDQKSYARESAKNIRGAMKAAKRKPPKGGMVRLKEITPVPVKEGSSGTTKQVMILNGQVPHLTEFMRSVFSPGDEVQAHSHATMDEVLYGEAGKGNMEVDGILVEVTPGTCVHVAAGQKYSLKNHGDEDWVVLVFGIATGPEGAAVSKEGSKGDVVSANALHAINP